jgi:predicted permease
MMLVAEQADVPRRRDVYFASYDFFPTLGIRAVRGRTFTVDEDRRGAPAVAVISDRYWRSELNADPNVVGRTVTVFGIPATIIGVLPRGFRGLYLSEAPDLYLPLHVAGDIDRRQFYNRDPLGADFFWIRVVGRLPSGETPAVAAARLNALGITRDEVGALGLVNVDTAAVPELARPGTARFTTLLAITVGLLLLIGCLTVGMLLLVRTEDRRDELAVRLALGATFSRLAVSLTVEAAILCALGAVLAVPLALWFSYGVRAFELPGSIAIERLDLTIALGPWLLVTATALTATGVIAVLASFLGVVGAVRSPLQPRALATPRVTLQAPRTVLVAGQVAITLVLVTGAGLFTRSLVAALSLNRTVDTGRIVTADINLAQYGYAPEQASAFIDELLQRLRGNGVIRSASIMHFVGKFIPGSKVAIDGVEREMPSSLAYGAADESFFSTIGLPLVRGRSFGASDTAASPPVTIVSESLGRFIAHGGNPIGRRIGPFRVGRAPASYSEIIGVVPDLITEVSTTEPFVAYQPVAQRPPAVATSIFLRAAGDPGAAMREAMATAKALDARVTLEGMMTLDEEIGQQMNPQRFGIYVLGALGGIALLLTVLGTYVIAESMLLRRRRELGIRAALGARSADLRRLVLADAARPVGIGLIAGFGLAVASARLIRSLLYQVRPLDPLVLVTTAAVIFAFALLVSLRPALAAPRLDLSRSLREE